MGPIEVRTYSEGTADASARRFQVDAAGAAKAGYLPASQVWEGTSLTVTYQLGQPVADAPPPPPSRADPVEVTAPKKPGGNSLVGGLIGLLVMGGLFWYFFLQPDAQTLQPGADRDPAPAARGAIADGVHVVGADVRPGTYRSRLPMAFCYWARLSGFGGTLAEIIANDNVVGSYGLVTISSSDVGFESTQCSWSTDLSAVLSPGAVVPDGVFIVGTDLEPGTYQTAGSQSCYWARVSGFGGTIGDIIANDNVSGPSVVTIRSGDRGFQSQGCSGWTRQ